MIDFYFVNSTFESFDFFNKIQTTHRMIGSLIIELTNNETIVNESTVSSGIAIDMIRKLMATLSGRREAMM